MIALSIIFLCVIVLFSLVFLANASIAIERELQNNPGRYMPPNIIRIGLFSNILCISFLILFLVYNYDLKQRNELLEKKVNEKSEQYELIKEPVYKLSK